ncbi:UNVERIFIED_CONTAM: hypothetical protein GTU68_011071 [Idotea baltica]|nr:hypothetical protein [Idotea baltica]
MALHLLEKDRAGASQLAQDIDEALQKIGRCRLCRNLTEAEFCDICADQRRDHSIVCVVETPMDVLALESAGSFRGIYFVLYGHLSPLDGIGPEELGLDDLKTLVVEHEIKEVILATNLTMEGEATAHYLSDVVQNQGVKISRIAHGVPTGGELEYVDGNTLSLALSSRKEFGG